MESIATLFEENIGKKIILFDLDGRRYEGVIKQVFEDFVKIFEVKQNMSKVIKFSSIKDFTLERNDN